MSENINLSNVGFLRLEDVLALYPVSKSTWWEGCKTGRFPKPVKLSPRCTAWKKEEILALIENASNQGG